MTSPILDALLKPNSVAVIGASRTPGKVGHEVLANLVAGGFQGVVVPVNPKTETLLGLECCQTVCAHGAPVDLCIVAVPLDRVRGAVEESLQAGARAIAIITAGFREMNDEGEALEFELVKLCKAHSARLLGPNCLGLINTHHRLNASFVKPMPRAGTISVISQSGAICSAILDWVKRHHLGVAKMVSIGNRADVTQSDLLTALGEDPETEVIVGYIESIEAGDVFIQAAREAASRKPVVLLKAGHSDAGSRAAATHRGGTSGEDIAYGAAFRQAGVVRADSLGDLLDFTTVFATQPLPEGQNVVVFSNAGGPGIVAADELEGLGFRVGRSSGGTTTPLRGKTPRDAGPDSPIDVLGDADPDRYAAAISMALADPDVHAVLVILTPSTMTQPADTIAAIGACERHGKPMLAVFIGGEGIVPDHERLIDLNLPDFDLPEKAVRALKALRDYSAWRRRPPRIVTRFAVNRRRVNRILRRQQRIGRSKMGELEAKEILGAYDFRVPAGGLATSAVEAIETAQRVGYPVAMKIVSPDVIHKTDVGGVRLNLATSEQVQDAFELMMLRACRRAPGAQLDGVYLEQMCPPGREVILGMTRDALFGPMLMFGLGGILVEAMKDVAFHLAPISEDEAMQMLQSTRSYALLEADASKGAIDLASIAGGIQRISQLATDFPQILDLDLHPFLVGEAGTDSIVADARMTVTLRKNDEP